MPSFTIRRFMDATISPKGDVISVRFETDTEQPLVLDFTTNSLEVAVTPLVGALERAREKAGAVTRATEATGVLLAMHLMGSAARQAGTDADPELELRLAPGRLPLRFAVPREAALELRMQIDQLLKLG